MTQQDIEQKILQRFAETNSKPNHIIDQRWLSFSLMDKLNPKEKELVNPAIERLINEGLITTDDRNGFCLVLTEKGFDTIYVIDNDDVTTKIANRILSRFAETNSKPNHIIDQRWLSFSLMDKLNPKEKELVNPAIERLINEGLITTDDRNGFCLVLTEKGFDKIY